MHRGSAQSSGRMDLDGGAPEWLFVVLGLESGPRAHSSAGERSFGPGPRIWPRRRQGARDRAPRTAGGEAAARTFGGRGCRGVSARPCGPRHHRRAGADRPRLDGPLAGCRRRGRSEQGRGVGMHRGSAQSSGRMDLDGGAPEWLFVVLGLESGPRAHSSAGERSLHTREVPGSIPGAPTLPCRFVERKPRGELVLRPILVQQFLHASAEQIRLPALLALVQVPV